MTANAAVSIVWVDGEYRFRLGIGQILELQDKCNAGPQEILGRLTDGTWRINDIRETIRLGLIGGGMKWPEALSLVTRHVDANALQESRPIARAIILAALIGVPSDQPGKSDADRTPADPIGSLPADSMERVLQ